MLYLQALRDIIDNISTSHPILPESHIPFTGNFVHFLDKHVLQKSSKLMHYRINLRFIISFWCTVSLWCRLLLDVGTFGEVQCYWRVWNIVSRCSTGSSSLSTMMCCCIITYIHAPYHWNHHRNSNITYEICNKHDICSWQNHPNSLYNNWHQMQHIKHLRETCFSMLSRGGSGG